ncbi:hypothetical protein [Nesterenkonia rhizosphaerae]|uniref:HNH endonuclease n=1 Tax=Nesterenkonia rhizosphaerae TaxID=1348272 RepID=A0ABP9FZP0_9MICC
MAYRVEDQILPADFPKPKRISIAEIVQERDGNHCRICSAQLHTGHADGRPDPRLVNLLPGRPAGERPELGMVLACAPCADDADLVNKAPESLDGYEQITIIQERRRLHVLKRMTRLLYLENCEMAKITPLRAVSL